MTESAPRFRDFERRFVYVCATDMKLAVAKKGGENAVTHSVKDWGTFREA
jgi:hypothetical protein